MKKILLGLAAGLVVVACNEPASIATAPKNTDLIHKNLKGKIQRLEEVPYKVDSTTGKILEIDTCCTGIDEYDERGLVTKYTTKDNKGTIKEENSYTRWDNGNVRDHIRMTNGKVVYKLIAKQNKNGTYGDAEFFDSTGKIEGYYNSTISDTVYHLISGWKRYKADSTLHSSGTRVFDKNFFISFTETDSIGKVVKTIKAKNDENGNPIEWTTVEILKDSTTTKVQTFKYEGFDEKGNWTQCTEFEKGNPVKVYKRTITYYKD